MNKSKILVVEDDAQVRQTIKRQLKDAAVEIVEAEDGGQAIEYLNSNPDHGINTIICDIRMPRVNGVEAVTYFRREHPSIPVIVLTGFPDVKLAVNFMDKGVFNYLVKPVEKQTLVSEVTRAVLQHAVITGRP